MEGPSFRGEMLNVAACLLFRYISGTVVSFRKQKELITKQDLKKVKINFSARERVHVVHSARQLSHANRLSLY